MYGVVTRSPEELGWDAFDRGFLEVKSVSGRARDPVPEGAALVSCFADNAVTDDDDLVPVDDAGNRATDDRPYFDWTYVCPTAEAYREGLLEMIGEAGSVTGDVRLDDVAFPREEYCHCDRCEQRFADSDYHDRHVWRTSVLTEFVANARERVPGRLSVTVYPDPYPGHLEARSGIDLAAVAAHADELVVPIYDTAYGTTYWLEILASAFRDRVTDLEAAPDLAVELYAVDVDVENLLDATEVADAYADRVYFGYDAANARAVIRRVTAGEREGETFGPE